MRPLDHFRRRLLFALGVDDLGAALARGLGLPRDGARYALVKVDAPRHPHRREFSGLRRKRLAPPLALSSVDWPALPLATAISLRACSASSS
jgi:hypothetical protein